MQITLTTAPAAEPITLAEAKSHLRAGDAEDTDITGLITAARKHAEDITNRVFVSQTWTAYLDLFPYSNQAIVLPRPPLISVGSVKYYDESDVLQTWSSANYTVDTDSYLGRIYPTRTESYPSARLYPKSVEIEFLAGYADSGDSPVDLADNVEEPIKQAIKIILAHFYENRELVVVGTSVVDVPMSAKALLAPYKVFNF